MTKKRPRKESKSGSRETGGNPVYDLEQDLRLDLIDFDSSRESTPQSTDHLVRRRTELTRPSCRPLQQQIPRFDDDRAEIRPTSPSPSASSEDGLSPETEREFLQNTFQQLRYTYDEPYQPDRLPSIGERGPPRCSISFSGPSKRHPPAAQAEYSGNSRICCDVNPSKSGPSLYADEDLRKNQTPQKPKRFKLSAPIEPGLMAQVGEPGQWKRQQIRNARNAIMRVEQNHVIRARAYREPDIYERVDRQFCPRPPPQPRPLMPSRTQIRNNMAILHPERTLQDCNHMQGDFVSGQVQAYTPIPPVRPKGPAKRNLSVIKEEEREVEVERPPSTDDDGIPVLYLDDDSVGSAEMYCPITDYTTQSLQPLPIQSNGQVQLPTFIDDERHSYAFAQSNNTFVPHPPAFPRPVRDGAKDWYQEKEKSKIRATETIQRQYVDELREEADLDDVSMGSPEIYSPISAFSTPSFHPPTSQSNGQVQLPTFIDDERHSYSFAQSNNTFVPHPPALPRPVRDGAKDWHREKEKSKIRATERIQRQYVDELREDVEFERQATCLTGWDLEEEVRQSYADYERQDGVQTYTDLYPENYVETIHAYDTHHPLEKACQKYPAATEDPPFATRLATNKPTMKPSKPAMANTNSSSATTKPAVANHISVAPAGPVPLGTTRQKQQNEERRMGYSTMASGYVPRQRDIYGRYVDTNGGTTTSSADKGIDGTEVKTATVINKKEEEGIVRKLPRVPINPIGSSGHVTTKPVGFKPRLVQQQREAALRNTRCFDDDVTPSTQRPSKAPAKLDAETRQYWQRVYLK